MAKNLRNPTDCNATTLLRTPQARRPRPPWVWIVAISLLSTATSSTAFAQLPVVEEIDPAGPPSEVRVTDRGTVRMHVADVPLSMVLHLLSLEGRRNIVASSEVSGTVTANLYDTTFEEALEAILVPNGAGFRMQGKFYYVYSKKELEELDDANRPPPTTTVYHLNYITSADAKTYLDPILDKEGIVTAPPGPAAGLASSADEGGSNSGAGQDFIIVTTRTAMHAKVAALIAEIDVRPRQVLIEATILRATLNDDNALGIDFSLVGGVDLELLGATSTAITGISLGQLPQDRFEKFNAAASTDLSGNVPSGGLTLGVIKDQVAIFVRALEEVTDTTVLANPKVLALNRQKAQIIVGRRDGFFTTTVTETQAIQTVEFLETGTQLIFRPFIGDDGFIRVELHPEDSVGFVNAQGLPSEQTTEVTTNVIVRDGETILIGGLFREVTTNAQSQVPGLGNMPVVGTLFQSESDTSRREEVIILLTIHIIKDRAAYADASRAQGEDVERLRVGIRQGLMGSGAERMAQTRYQRAIENLAAGDQAKAIWNLNMALHSQPRLLPAIMLKEKLLAERAWDDEGVGNRMFLRSLIAREKGYELTPLGRPIPVIEDSRDDGSAPK